MWDRVRRHELSRYPWLFARTRAKLPAEAAVPAFGWARQFILPSDCLRVIQIGTDGWLEDREGRYELENGRILTDDAAPLSILYIRDVTDTARFDASFVEVLAARIAVEIAETVTGIAGKVQMAEAMYREAVADARRNNAIQRPPQRMGGLDPWSLSRGVRRRFPWQV